MAATGLWALRASLPADGEQHIPQLNAVVRVQYDDWQRPFVDAQSFEDALAAQGWLHAQHRLWQMELLRQASHGRLANLVGPAGLDADKQLWRFGVPQLGERFAANGNPSLQSAVASYVHGVNAALAQYRILPPEFLLLRHSPEPWQVEDIYAVSALLAFQSANNADRELLRLALANALPDQSIDLFFEDLSHLPDYPFVLSNAAPGENARGENAAREVDVDNPAAALDAADLAQILDPINPLATALLPSIALGSNGWVVSPGRSASGYALFAFDSHDQLGLPNLFYEVHLSFAGRELHGWSVPGLPGVVNGYNDSIAWGFTNIGDSQDLFLETRGDKDTSFVEDGEHYTARVERISIPVRGAATEMLEVLHTRNGPLIHSDPPISLAWTAHKTAQPSGDALLEMNLATDWASFNAALDKHTAPTLNATYADSAGNIGFRTLGLLPQRSQGQGLMPLTSTAAHRWLGLVPAQDMPRLKNPDSGFIAAANARVAAPGSYPLVSADNAAPYRIRRIQAVLAANSALATADMQALQMDWLDSQAVSVLPVMLQGLPQRESLRAARATLSEWAQSPLAHRDSAGALLFQTWYLTLADRLFGAALTPELYAQLRRQNYVLNAALDALLLTNRHPQWWPGRRADILAASLRDAIASLEQSQGGVGDWRLDRAQSVTLEHELSKAVPLLSPLLASKKQPWGGSPATVGRASYSYRKPFTVTKGATVRAVGEMTSPPRFKTVIPGGQSGHPLSPHYLDQFPAWLSGDLLDIVAPTSGSVTTLRP
ncbi:MAG: penicillin acylase family protein [Pseudomonadota bacterium]